MCSDRAEDGFDALYLAHGSRAVRFAVVLTGNAARGEDVAAAAMLKVYRRWRRGGVEQFWPYLRTAILNQYRTELRRDRRSDADAPVELEEGSTAFDEDIVGRAELLAALAELPARQRAAITLRYLEDLSEADVADLLGCPVGTVKSTVSRGLTTLRRHLEGALD
jgi:RNA polymerase sigma-70 factor (sigma-E family)